MKLYIYIYIFIYKFKIGVVLSNIIQFNIFLLDANFDNSIFFFWKEEELDYIFFLNPICLQNFEMIRNKKLSHLSSV